MRMLRNMLPRGHAQAGRRTARQRPAAVIFSSRSAEPTLASDPRLATNLNANWTAHKLTSSGVGNGPTPGAPQTLC
jgi:hypothetical protein